MEPELRLWHAVLLRCLADTQWLGKETDHRGYETEGHRACRVAKQWIEDNTEGFRGVCLLGGFDPDAVREKYLNGELDLRILLEDRAVWQKQARKDWR